MEVTKEIDNNSTPKNSPGYDEIPPSHLQKLPNKPVSLW